MKFPAGFDRGLTIDLESYDAEFDTTVILETEFHENNNIFISYKYKRNWKIVSTINVTYAPIQINWARNIASKYFSQQQPASPRSQMLLFFSVNYVICSRAQPEKSNHRMYKTPPKHLKLVWWLIFSDVIWIGHHNVREIGFLCLIAFPNSNPKLRPVKILISEKCIVCFSETMQLVYLLNTWYWNICQFRNWIGFPSTFINGNHFQAYFVFCESAFSAFVS